MIWKRFLTCSCAFVLLVSGFAMSGKASANSGSFPSEAWNGLQVSYSISGATVTGSEDKNGEPRSNGFTSSRSLSGTLGSGVLQVSGSIRAGGLSSDAVVTVTAGDQTRDYRVNIPGGQSQSYSVSVPIPAGASSGSISVSVLGNYNNSGGTTRDVVVRGTFAGSVPPKQEPPKQEPPKQEPPKQEPPKQESPKNPLLFPPNAAPNTPTPPPAGGTVSSPAKPPAQPPEKPPETAPKTDGAETKAPEDKGTDWKKVAAMGAIAVVAGAIAAILASVGIWGFVMMTAPDIGLAPVLSPVLMRLAVGLWTMPYVGAAVQGVFKGLLTFTQTGIPGLKLLWQHYGNFKDYLAHSDFWKRHHEQLGNVKFPSNWDYDKGPSGGRRER